MTNYNQTTGQGIYRFNYNEANKDFDFVKKVIDCCENDFHFDCVVNLIELYRIKSGNEEKTLELKLISKDKWNQLHAIVS